MRSGKAYLATPLSRVEVRSNPKADRINDLESGGFLDRLQRFARSEQAPAGIRSQVRRLEDALFTLTRHSDKATLQKILRIIGQICFSLSKTTNGREAVPRLPRLKESWGHDADDGTPEFRCAVALAALNHTDLPLLPFILPTKRAKVNDNWQWAPESRSAIWREGSLTNNLCSIAARRHLARPATAGRISRAGVSTADLQRFFDRSLDEKRLAKLEKRLAELLLGLILADIPTHPFPAKDPVPLPAGYLVLKPLFTPQAQLVQLGFLTPDRTLPRSGEPIVAPNTESNTSAASDKNRQPDQTLPRSGQLIANLRADKTQEAVKLGWRRLRISGIPIPAFPQDAPAASGIDGPRLLAALAIPLRSKDLSYCLKALVTESDPTPEQPKGEPA